MNVPDKGFYYHYKHEPNGAFNQHAYEVVGIGWHTEEDHAQFVIYRPLDESAFVYKQGKMYDVRPLKMFMEEIEKDGKKMPRFTKITDKELIKRLEQVREKMYSGQTRG